MQNIPIGHHTIGKDQPAFIVAEIGINHNGDLVLAKEQIAAAAEAGADSVKFQNYGTEDFLSDHTLEYTYQTYNNNDTLEEITESQFEMFKRCELSLKDLEELAEACIKHNVIMHSTPTSQKGIDDLLHVKTPVLKNGSDYLPNLDLIRAMGQTGLPTVLSTGMAIELEIDEAVQAFRETGNEQLIILHCTSAYPTPPHEVNIQRIKTIRDKWQVLSGFSDHSEGTTASILSVAYGACWIEKHFTSDKKLKGPDHRFSLDPDELRTLVKAVRAAEAQIGSPLIDLTESEAKNREGFRLSCVANENIPAGAILKAEDIAYRRPGTGIRPALVNTLTGRQLKNAVPRGHVFKMEDFA